MNVKFATLAVFTLVSLPVLSVAQARELTVADYQHAEKYLGFNTRPLLDNTVSRITWADDGHFWYVEHDAKGDHFLAADASSGKISPAFDQNKMAKALGKTLDKPLQADKLPVTDFSVTDKGTYDVSVHGKHFLCDLSGKAECTARITPKPAKGEPAPGDEPGRLSPDGKKEAFIRDWNLWVRDVATGKESQLTTDGVKDYGYATDNAGWLHSNRAIVNWSPDSSMIATYQQDQRGVGEMYTVNTRVGHPKLEQWKYPLPGDKKIFMIEPVVIDVASHKLVRLQLPPQQRLSSLCDDLDCDRDGTWDDVKWAADGKTLAMVNSSRDRRHEWFRVADAATGAVRTAFEDSVKTFYESGRGMVDWQYLPKTGEAIWFSEKSDWGNLYLYDLGNGTIKRAITGGSGTVAQVLHMDRDTRTLWFDATGRTQGVNPYYRQFWKVGIDGGQPVLLTPEKADHSIKMSPDGRFFVDTYSTRTTAPVTVLRASDDGHVIREIARADTRRLVASGWRPPVPFTVKARDGKTDLYGMMFKPTHFDPKKKYPIIDYIYPGPQVGSVRGRSFLPRRSSHQALAELGFIVVAIDGMGTPWRSKSFHDTWYGDMGDNTLPDQVAAIRQLAQRNRWIDLDRVGIWGHSGGGNATADAMFRYPELFKVGWSESGNHDNRNYENDWGEKYQGLLVRNKDGGDNYDNQANQDVAKNLKGHLMLVHGQIDDNVPTGETMLVVQALIKANKDFDMLIIPNAHHGYGIAGTMYSTRRRWDYFVRYLAGKTPPTGFHFSLPESMQH
ncbi:MAG: DPP IV N-terminal domain-containing protein [Rhodanobacteraceae bacterium]